MPSAETRLAHRRLALHALRQLARGHYLVVAGETSLAIRLPGVPDAAHLAEDLVGGGLVAPVSGSQAGAVCYTLSPAGRDALQRGEQWWRELGLFQRFVVHITG